MTATEANEYRSLQHESSNHLLEHDSRLVLGRCEEAAHHLLEAGLQRARMGRIQFGSGNAVAAAEDWLSAAECFLRTKEQKLASDAIRDLAQMRHEGMIPLDRADLLDALQDRERRLQKLTAAKESCGDVKTRTISPPREKVALSETAKLT